MSIFNQILSAIDNPEQEASTNQLSSILDTVQQLSGSNQANPDAIQSAMSIVGNYTKSALQQKRNNGNMGQVNQLVNQFGGTQANSQVLSALFSNSQLQDMIQQISSRTGLNSKTIISLLPILVPLVLNLLKTGNKRGNVQANNPVVNGFLDSDGDGDVDLADAMRMASRYLGR
ncbi:DUF937 domain-containing protein [Waterburya agarophytonicola K14]|uniref:DUF937 domain-containing protein n=1 Tax=Waterburya agarophytonicola KI4 TaxID=2874699 RepID=A0A964BTV1_9CYAN|nr:hypothetical protein [Waterburya agarophytonicola]MCC0179719.1 DUF937 domain-containing protein [Waterburya agarophytonicola KI4]